MPPPPAIPASSSASYSSVSSSSSSSSSSSPSSSRSASSIFIKLGIPAGVPPLGSPVAQGSQGTLGVGAHAGGGGQGGTPFLLDRPALGRSSAGGCPPGPPPGRRAPRLTRRGVRRRGACPGRTEEVGEVRSAGAGSPVPVTQPRHAPWAPSACAAGRQPPPPSPSTPSAGGCGPAPPASTSGPGGAGSSPPRRRRHHHHHHHHLREGGRREENSFSGKISTRSPFPVPLFPPPPPPSPLLVFYFTDGTWLPG